MSSEREEQSRPELQAVQATTKFFSPMNLLNDEQEPLLKYDWEPGRQPARNYVWQDWKHIWRWPDVLEMSDRELIEETVIGHGFLNAWAVVTRS